MKTSAVKRVRLRDRTLSEGAGSSPDKGIFYVRLIHSVADERRVASQLSADELVLRMLTMSA